LARPSPPILSREAIIDVAWHVINAEGAGALSMRRLAAELGVSGPSLYHHFASKDEILDRIAERIDNEIHLEPAAPDWERVLTDYACQLRAVLTAHPLVVEVFALRPVTSPAGLRIYEHMISQLSACGWDVPFGREVTLAVENLVFGAALMANAPNLKLTAEQRDSYPRLAQFSDRPPHEYPDDGFEVGFAALIAGLRTITKARHSPPRATSRRARADAAGGSPASRRLAR
jgi:AcrR family transcriptional regulator